MPKSPLPSSPPPAALLALLLAGAAHAAGGDAELTSVTVTANKIEQDFQSVPQSITVIDAATLEEKGITRVVEVVREIPNMYNNSAGGNGLGLNFRGANASMFTNNNPVVVYIDGVHYANRYGFDPSLANVERVEVLRGPQGSLYGKDAIGAVINIVTRKPENDWHGAAGVEFAENATRFGSFNAGGALVEDTLYAGINGQARSDDGWIENTWPGMPGDAAAKRDGKLGAYLLYTPSAALSAKLSLSQDRYTAHAWENQLAPSGTPLAAFSRAAAAKARFDVPTKETGDTDAQSLLLTWRLGSVTLDAVTAHKTFAMDGSYDADFAASPVYAGLTQFNHTRTETWSQELRLASSATAGLRWVAGLYLEKEKHDQGPYGMQFPYFDAGTMSFLGNFGMNAESTTDVSTRALFGQLIYPFGAAELTLGGRWQTIEKQFDVATYSCRSACRGPPCTVWRMPPAGTPSCPRLR